MERSLRTIFIMLSFLATGYIVHASVNLKIQNSEVIESETQEVVTLAERTKQLECLAMNIYKEAGYEPFEGKVAVAQVTLYRVADSDFPNDICGVVYQKSKGTKVVCQFSWYCDRVHKTRPVGDKAYKESYEVAKKVLLENFKLDTLKEALYYHADYINPKWNKTKVGKFGVHIFYKDKG